MYTRRHAAITSFEAPSLKLKTDGSEALLLMLKKDEESEERSSNIAMAHNNEFYTAIMEEDLTCIEDMSKKYGSNVLIQVKDGAHGKVFLKVKTTMQKLLTMTNIIILPNHTQMHSERDNYKKLNDYSYIIQMIFFF